MCAARGMSILRLRREPRRGAALGLGLGLAETGAGVSAGANAEHELVCGHGKSIA